MDRPEPAASLVGGSDRRQPTLRDVVDTWDEARRLDAAPLIVRERLRNVLGLAEMPEVTRIDAGHSNPTFLVSSGGSLWVLRRPPRPPFAPTAHDVLREHRILTALRDEAVRTPLPVFACEDPALMGAPFYVMEALDGVVLRNQAVPPLDTPAERARAGEALVGALAELHAVDPGRVGAGDEDRGSRYLERQVALWSEQWEKNQTRQIPALDEVTRHLRRELPVTQRVTLVHGDYKLDNVMFAPAAPARVVAILDWEMATIGDPLADLGFLSATWIDPGEDADRVGGLCRATMQPGFPSRRELVECYAQLTELDLEHLNVYQAMALWKLAILLEASYRRYLSGTAADPFFVTLGSGVPLIAEQALAALRGAL